MPLQNILHTGDMRWHPRMGRHPALRARRIDLLFLDTTYASPQHVFPSQVRIYVIVMFKLLCAALSFE